MTDRRLQPLLLLLSQHALESKPRRPDEARYDHRNHRLERIALRLLNAFAPSPQMLKVRSQFLPILLFQTERDQNGCDSLLHCSVNAAVLLPLLFRYR